MDWMSDAADEAGQRIADYLQVSIRAKAWTDFSARLSEHGRTPLRAYCIGCMAGDTTSPGSTSK